MTKLEFSINLPADTNHLIDLATQYEKYPFYLPDQLKSVKILEKNNNETITEEILSFSTIFKNTIKQKSIHRKILDNQLNTSIISGPAKGTTVNAKYDRINSGTKVTIDIDLKLSFKVKILIPIIKKWYQRVLTSILYKMNNVALESKTINEFDE